MPLFADLIYSVVYGRYCGTGVGWPNFLFTLRKRGRKHLQWQFLQKRPLDISSFIHVLCTNAFVYYLRTVLVQTDLARNIFSDIRVRMLCRFMYERCLPVQYVWSVDLSSLPSSPQSGQLIRQLIACRSTVNTYGMRGLVNLLSTLQIVHILQNLHVDILQIQAESFVSSDC